MKNTKLSKARIDAGITQAQVAREVGITELAYQNYEAGRRVPRVDVAIKIADALGVTVKDIFSDNGRESIR